MSLWSEYKDLYDGRKKLGFRDGPMARRLVGEDDGRRTRLAASGGRKREEKKRKKRKEKINKIVNKIRKF